MDGDGMPNSKVCTGCREEKPLEAFYRCVRGRDSRMAVCKSCRALAKKKAKKPGYAEGVKQRRDERAAADARWLADQRKPCSVCEAVKPLSEFHKQERGRLGLHSQCRACGRKASLESMNSAYAADPEKFLKRQNDARALDPEKSQQRQRDAYAANPESFRQAARERRAADPEKFREQARDRREADPSRHRAQNAKRRAAKLDATPPWSETKDIKQFYGNLPEGHHGDHEIPLQGELVSGLHVIANLQYLTSAENWSKGNSFNPDDWYWVKGLDTRPEWVSIGHA